MISSTSNALIGLAKDLAKTKYRNETGLFLLEGEKFVRDAIKQGLALRHLLVDEAHFEAYAHIEGVVGVKKKLFLSFATTSTPQGVAGIFEKPPFCLEHAALRNILFLNAVQDSANVGALIRSADCAGFDAVLLDTGSADPFSPKTIRSSAGSVLNLPVERKTDGIKYLQELKEKGFELIATSLEAQGSLSFQREKNVLLLGSEGQGLSQMYLDLCTKKVKIPMKGKAQSLNVAAAGVILMYKISGIL